jgi:hypothetical protein
VFIEDIIDPGSTSYAKTKFISSFNIKVCGKNNMENIKNKSNL